MLNMPGLKFDKSIKYLENQLNIQTNNKQLILDIITNIGLIINNNSSNNNEELHGVLDIANDFLQDISNNITTLEQLNLEISNITEELNGIMKEQAENTKTKEYYIAALSNIKNHIAQYTEKFQEFQKKLDIDNDDFNDFINDNNFKYTFETVEDSENTDTYELTSFSVNDEATIVTGNTEVKNSDEEFNQIEQDVFGDFSANIEYIETPEETSVTDEEIEVVDEITEELEASEEVENVADEISDEPVVENAETIEEPVVENEQDKKINEITNEFKETLLNLYNSGVTDLDASSVIADYLKGLASPTSSDEETIVEENEITDETPVEENIDSENEVEIVDEVTTEDVEEPEVTIENTYEEPKESVVEENISINDESVEEIIDEVVTEEATTSDVNEEVAPVETVIDESVKNVIDIQYIKSLQQNVLSIYNDLSNIADNILNEYDAFPTAIPSLNTNVVPLVNNEPVNVEVEQPVENIVETINGEVEEPVIEDVQPVETVIDEIPNVEEIIDEVIPEENIENPIDNLIEETLDFNNEVETITEEPVVEISEEIELPEEISEETISIEDIFEDFVEDASISPIEELGTTLEETEIGEIEELDDIENIIEENSDTVEEIEIVDDVAEELENVFNEVPEKQDSGIDRTPSIGILQYLENLELNSEVDESEVSGNEETSIEDIEEIETIDDIVEDALFNIIEEPTVDETPTEDIENTNTECNEEENTDIAYDIIVDEPINNIVEENETTIEEPTVVEEFEEQVFENKEIHKEEQTLIEIEDNFSTTDEVLENTLLEETATTRNGLDFEVNTLLDDELNDKLNLQDISSYRNPVKVVEDKKTQETTEKVVAQKPIINENTPAEEIIAHIKKADDANKILLISETTNKVYLPYRISELVNYIDYYPNVYRSLQDVVEQEFVLDLDDFMKHPARSRFLETYNLIKNRSGKSTMQALSTALKLYKNRFLNPAIIAACKSDYELNCYLDALVTDNLDSFNFFKVVYDVKPL